MKVYIVGTGVGGRDTLTNEAEKAIAEAELLIGAERMLKAFSESDKEIFCSYKPDEIAEYIRTSEKKTAAVLMSGDCGFFSGAKKLLPLLDGMEIRIVSGISSAVYFCSKLGISYENMKYVTLHGRDDNIAVNVKVNEKCFFLLGGTLTAPDVCGRLCKYGMGEVRIHIGENLGYKNESVLSGTAQELSEILDGHTEKLTVLVTENPDHLGYIPSAIDDDEFIRDKIPMTKAEVRGAAVSALNICRDSVCWDIGSGSGSVSVEMAFRCPDGKVIAFEQNVLGCCLTEKNSLKFGCDNIQVRRGSFPEVLSSPQTAEAAGVPDKVFIGGSSGKMGEIFDCVYGINPEADILLTAVSLETLSEAVKCFEKYGGAYTVSQIAVTRTKKVGNHTMLGALDPIFIIKGRLK